MCLVFGCRVETGCGELTAALGVELICSEGMNMH